MQFLVIELHPAYAVLLDQEGRFVRAANLGYTVGQRVSDPVLLAEQTRRRRWPGIAATLAACLAVALGVLYYVNYLLPFSSIFLSINPQVQIDVNRRGAVVRVIALNDDAEVLLAGYQGRGKDQLTVTEELIDRAIALGYLSPGGSVTIDIDAPDQATFQAYGFSFRDGLTGETHTVKIGEHNSAAEVPALLPTASGHSSTGADGHEAGHHAGHK